MTTEIVGQIPKQVVKCFGFFPGLEKDKDINKGIAEMSEKGYSVKSMVYGEVYSEESIIILFEESPK